MDDLKELFTNSQGLVDPAADRNSKSNERRKSIFSRIKSETGSGIHITGRGMDWNDPNAKTDLWVFPGGMGETEICIGKGELTKLYYSHQTRLRRKK